MQLKNSTLVFLLAGLAVAGPILAYAGISIIYPKSTHTVNIETNPPIQFIQGADYAQGNNMGFLSNLALIDNDAAFNITISGLSGGNYTIDNYTMIWLDEARVSSFKMQIADAISGTLDANMIQDLKIQLWTGATPPSTANGWWNGVCARLDLESALNTESTGGPCDNSYTKVQLIFQLRTNSAGTSTLAVRPSSLVLV
jgi:hypothetical protein